MPRPVTKMAATVATAEILGVASQLMTAREATIRSVTVKPKWVGECVEFTQSSSAF